MPLSSYLCFHMKILLIYIHKKAQVAFCREFHLKMFAYVSWPDAQKTSMEPRSFWFKIMISSPFWFKSMPCTSTNSSYRLNTTDFQFSQYHPQTLKMKSYQKLSPTLKWVSWSILMLPHKDLITSTYNFPSTPNSSHASLLCSATHWTQYDTVWYGDFFSISYTTRWHAAKRWAHPPTTPPPNVCRSRAPSSLLPALIWHVFYYWDILDCADTTHCFNLLIRVVCRFVNQQENLKFAFLLNGVWWIFHFLLAGQIGIWFQ